MKRFRIIVTPAARIELNVHYRFIAKRSETWAATWNRRYTACIDALVVNPHHCGFAPEENDAHLGVRESFFGRKPQVYRVLYRILDDTVIILHIRHCKQDQIPPEEF